MRARTSGGMCGRARPVHSSIAPRPPKPGSYAILTAAEILVSITCLEFSYTQVMIPPHPTPHHVLPPLPPPTLHQHPIVALL